MKNQFKTLAGIFLSAVLSFNANAQLKVPAPSPTQTIKQNFALSDISIEYSRPSMKGRVIYGDLVPFDAMWRTGANACTKVTFGENVKVEGNDVPAGSYSLFTIPGKAEWTIILNKNTTVRGLDGYKQEEDLVRFKVKPSALGNKVETFTINVADITAKTANIELLWDQTRIAFAVVADIDAKIMKDIEMALSPADKRPYFQAAAYYYDNDKDMKQALEWASKGVDQNPKAYWVLHLKAKIQMKLKDYPGAIATAEKSIAAAKEDKNDDYVKLNEKLIAEAKAGK